MALALIAATMPAFPQEPVRCEIDAEIIDKDPKGLNIRSGPSSKHPVVGNLDIGSTVVSVSAAVGQWMRVKSAGDENGTKDFSKSEAWVFGPLLGFDVWARHPAKTAPLRAAPDPKSAVLATVPVDKSAVLTGCQGRWAKARVDGKEGWLAPEHRCANPFTTCN